MPEDTRENEGKKWDKVFDALMDLSIMLSPLDIRLGDYRPKYKEWLTHIRMLPPEQKQEVFRSLYYIAKFCIYSIIFASNFVDEVPRRLRPIFKKVYSKVDYITVFTVWDALFMAKTLDPFEVFEAFDKVSSVWRHEIPPAVRPFKIFPWSPSKLKKRSVEKNLRMKSKAYLKSLLGKPYVAINRMTEAKIYRSPLSEVYVVMNEIALGRGKTITKAVEDFIRRWHVLVKSEFESRIPKETYIQNMCLEELGNLYVVEFEDETLRWRIEWTDQRIHKVVPSTIEQKSGNELPSEEKDNNEEEESQREEGEPPGAEE